MALKGAVVRPDRCWRRIRCLTCAFLRHQKRTAFFRRAVQHFLGRVALKRLAVFVAKNASRCNALTSSLPLSPSQCAQKSCAAVPSLYQDLIFTRLSHGVRLCCGRVEVAKLGRDFQLLPSGWDRGRNLGDVFSTCFQFLSRDSYANHNCIVPVAMNFNKFPTNLT